MEGITFYFKPKGNDEYEKHFYSILSTEESQDGNVVYPNTKIMSLTSSFAKVMLLMVLLFQSTYLKVWRTLMHKLAIEMDMIYDRGIDCEGHGKDDVDGEQGISKTDLSNKFRGNAVYQPEAMDPSRNSIL